MRTLLQQTRDKIIENHVGLIDDRELVRWADTQILDLDEPPSFILDLAMRQLPDDEPELDLVRTKVGPGDCANVMATVSEKFRDGTIDVNRVGEISYKMALKTNGRPSDLLHWISDEIHLCGEGIKELSESLPSIKNAIEELVQYDA